MQANLEQLGFKVTQQADPWNRITDIATKLETTPAVSQIFFGPTYPSPDSMFFTAISLEGGGHLDLDGMARRTPRSTP